MNDSRRLVDRSSLEQHRDERVERTGAGKTTVTASLASARPMLARVPGAQAPAPAANAGGPVCDTSSAARQGEAQANNPLGAGENREFAQAQASADLRNFFSSLEQMRPGGTGDQVLLTLSGREQVYNRSVADQLREAVRREFATRIARLTAMLAGARAAMATLRLNGNDVTNPIDFPRLESAYDAALGDLGGLRAALAENLFSYMNSHLGAAASECRSVEQQVAGIRGGTLVAECTAYGLEFVRDLSLAVFAVAAVAATGGLAGGALTAGAAMMVEGAQQGAEVATGQRSEVNGTEVAMRGVLAGLSTLFGAVGSELVSSVGGRLLVSDVERLLVEHAGGTASQAAVLAPWATKKVIKWALDQVRSGMGIGSGDIAASTGVSARTSSTTVPTRINDGVRARLPEDQPDAVDPISAAIHYVHTIDYEAFVRTQARTWARDFATGAADVRGQTPSSSNTVDVASERVSSARR